ncbi:MAG: DUF308 domain-containing protein [Promethearchaeota archaeon]
MKLELLNKKKIRADDYISILAILNFFVFFIFFRLEAIIAIAVYPLAALTIYGLLNIINGLNKKLNNGHVNVNKILRGIFYIICSISFLIYIVFHPNTKLYIMISLFAFIIINVGIAGIIKGLMIDSYSKKNRVVNIILGIITIIICIIVFSSRMNNFLYNIVVLSLTLLLNIFSRAALYLSEYGLSLLHIRNFVLFLYIISDYLLYVARDGNVLLAKIE